MTWTLLQYKLDIKTAFSGIGIPIIKTYRDGNLYAGETTSSYWSGPLLMQEIRVSADILS